MNIDHMVNTAALVGGRSTTGVLLEFSARYSRHFVFFKEEHLDYGYPGAGIGFSFQSQPDSVMGSLTEAVCREEAGR